LKDFTPKRLQEFGECNNCWLRYLCGGGCIWSNFIKNKNPGILDLDRCKLNEIKWKNYLILFQKIYNNKPEYFDKFKSMK
jgi:uncharacterized protein